MSSFIDCQAARIGSSTLRRVLGRAVGGALLAGVFACDPEVMADSQEPEERLYVLSSEVWSSPQIPVCWETAGFATEKEWVRDAVLRSWQGVSNATFTGWGQCGDAPSGIRIGIADVGPHVVALGEALDGVENGMVLNFTFASWGNGLQAQRETNIRAIAVHEFGHALGFAHEHNREDTPASCTADPQGTNGDVEVGPWDGDSVMNYCKALYDGQGGTLSETDVLGAQYFYGTRGYKDYNRDGQYDIALHDTASGAIQMWFMWGTDRVGFNYVKEQATQQIHHITSPWSIATSGDINGDYKNDLLLHNATSGEVQVWFMDGTDRVGFTSVKEQATQQVHHVTAPWKLVGTGDIDLDGETDLLWHNLSSGMIQVWFMEGSDRTGFSYVKEQATQQTHQVTAPWSLRSLADMDRDGNLDLLWQNTSSGEVQTWFMEGTDRTGFNYVKEQATQQILTVASPWQLVDTGAVNGDRSSDIVLHNTATGQIQTWFMDGTDRVGFNLVKEQSTQQVIASTWKLIAQ